MHLWYAYWSHHFIMALTSKMKAGHIRKISGWCNWQKLKELFSYLCIWTAHKVSRFRDLTKDYSTAAMILKILICHWIIHMSQTRDPWNLYTINTKIYKTVSSQMINLIALKIHTISSTYLKKNIRKS